MTSFSSAPINLAIWPRAPSPPLLGFPAVDVAARAEIAELVGKVRHHHFQDPRVHGRGGLVIQVDRLSLRRIWVMAVMLTLETPALLQLEKYPTASLGYIGHLGADQRSISAQFGVPAQANSDGGRGLRGSTPMAARTARRWTLPEEQAAPALI